MPDEPRPAADAFAATGPPHPQSLLIRGLPGGRGLALDGEADINSRPALREALRGLAGTGAASVDLDLAGLRFIDVSCMREITQGIERLRPMRVRLLHAPRTFRRVAAFLAPGPDGRRVP